MIAFCLSLLNVQNCGLIGMCSVLCRFNAGWCSAVHASPVSIQAMNDKQEGCRDVAVTKRESKTLVFTLPMTLCGS